MLLPLLKEHSFSLSLGPVENTAVQTNACDLTGTDGSYREAFGSPPLDAALNPPGDECLVLWRSLVSLRVFTRASLGVPPCSSVRGSLPERLQPLRVAGSREATLVYELF